MQKGNSINFISYENYRDDEKNNNQIFNDLEQQYTGSYYQEQIDQYQATQDNNQFDKNLEKNSQNKINYNYEPNLVFDHIYGFNQGSIEVFSVQREDNEYLNQQDTQEQQNNHWLYLDDEDPKIYKDQKQYSIIQHSIDLDNFPQNHQNTQTFQSQNQNNNQQLNNFPSILQNNEMQYQEIMNIELNQWDSNSEQNEDNQQANSSTINQIDHFSYIQNQSNQININNNNHQSENNNQNQNNTTINIDQNLLFKRQINLNGQIQNYIEINQLKIQTLSIENKQNMRKILIDYTQALNSLPPQPSTQFMCFCSKHYEQKKNLQKHIQNKHSFLPEIWLWHYQYDGNYQF
ncbi:hypothetical protein TTHERM_00024270 (macronuclear) [Tetrahymena thermophila SB210]|uniref:Uncharacterized protein n=1 Tax=Tetrahymena thermophila (strain SB210) TaxID=312017 RepID=Q22R54_TETTS|nr:hypothetical protein TTHERM_00024270 [Tetrahymena thermophila SB210]EAR88268.1 hypothetical protein TTHERM_00024270 [Tetrahymena thermophila SB210]|eukprot:XP_001008513.1 hypothetical protein TTHERM_00024270 [Tetrahymena thermophila SB210]